MLSALAQVVYWIAHRTGNLEVWVQVPAWVTSFSERLLDMA